MARLLNAVGQRLRKLDWQLEKRFHFNVVQFLTQLLFLSISITTAIIVGCEFGDTFGSATPWSICWLFCLAIVGSVLGGVRCFQAGYHLVSRSGRWLPKRLLRTYVKLDLALVPLNCVSLWIAGSFALDLDHLDPNGKDALGETLGHENIHLISGKKMRETSVDLVVFEAFIVVALLFSLALQSILSTRRENGLSLKPGRWDEEVAGPRAPGVLPDGLSDLSSYPSPSE